MKKVNLLRVLSVVSSITLPVLSQAAFELPKVKEYIDLNHGLEQNMETYPGLSEVNITNIAPRYKNGALIDKISFLGISGTYIDAPFHVNDNGKKISDYPIEKLANLPIVVIEKPKDRNYYDVADFKKLHIQGKAVLLHTGLSKYFGTPKYSENPPYLSVDAAKYLVREKVALVGIDALLVDDFKHNETIPIHNMLLGHGIVIAEDMANIDSVIGKNAYLTAVPPRVPMTSFPTRIFATVY